MAIKAMGFFIFMAVGNEHHEVWLSSSLVGNGTTIEYVSDQHKRHCAQNEFLPAESLIEASPPGKLMVSLGGIIHLCAESLEFPQRCCPPCRFDMRSL